jgi:hypothetical protein
MEPRPGRILSLVAAAALAFAGVAGGLTLVIPEPRRQTDYLVIGTVATFASLLTIFVVVVTGVLRPRDGFFFRRRKITEE